MLKQEDIRAIEEAIGYTFRDKGLLTQAFTRASYANEHPETLDNQQLEYVGDAVLSAAVVSLQVRDFAGMSGRGLRFQAGGFLDEGNLSRMRSDLTSQQHLSWCVRERGLERFLLGGRGDEQRRFRQKAAPLEDLFESILGAVFIDCGCTLKPATEVAERLLYWAERHEKRPESPYDPSVLLRGIAARMGLPEPVYEEGPPSLELETGVLYSVYCWIEGLRLQNPELLPEGAAKGEGRTFREAGERAAALLMQAMRLDDLSALPQESIKGNMVNILQEYCQKQRWELPQYEVLENKTLPDNSHAFTVRCTLNGRSSLGEAAHLTSAKQHAAFMMFTGVV